MKTIGIVTYYDAINEGAFLQAYCLKKFLEDNFDVKVYFVENDKVNNLRLQRQSLFYVKNPKALLNNMRRYFALRAAQQNFLPVQKCTGEIDAVIVGSDEMWNVGNTLFSSYNIDGGVSTGRKISYAVSMGNFSDKLPPKMVTELEGFSALSVRDYNAQDVLKRSGIAEAHMHLDPVFLVDIPAQVPKKNVLPFLLVYGNIRKESNIRAIQQFAREKGLKTVSVDICNKWCDMMVTAKSPFEFVGYIDAADFIVTNMFHGTMLSIVRNRPFISIQTQRRRKKIEYAAEKLVFSSRCVDESDFIDASIVQEEPLNYEYINSIIQEERKFAKSYFSKALELT